MKESNNIEQLFKETFEHFESDVNPKVWSNIQNHLNAPAGNGASSSGDAGTSAGIHFGIGKIAAVISALAVTAGTVWYVANQQEKTASSKKSETQNISAQNVQQNNEQVITAENNSSTNNISEQKNNSVSSSHQQKNQSQNLQSSSSTNSAAENSNTASGNNGQQTSAAETPHKYGKAPTGPTALVRGSAGNKSAPKETKNNSSNNPSDDGPEPLQPSATIFASIISGDAPLTVNFSNQGVASSLRWNFGDGNSSDETSPSHIFAKAGTYKVALAASGSGKQASNEITIEVKPISDILNVPNVFSPNGDGVNDQFKFEMKNISSVSVTIFDTYNKIIYRWNTLDGSWDGKTLSGMDAAGGNYFYQIEATGTDGIHHTKNGVMMLSR